MAGRPLSAALGLLRPLAAGLAHGQPIVVGALRQGATVPVEGLAVPALGVEHDGEVVERLGIVAPALEVLAQELFGAAQFAVLRGRHGLAEVRAARGQGDLRAFLAALRRQACEQRAHGIAQGGVEQGGVAAGAR